ncbi:hypothetical protein BX616_009185, partial [Lobosporangium transversale]
MRYYSIIHLLLFLILPLMTVVVASTADEVTTSPSINNANDVLIPSRTALQSRTNAPQSRQLVVPSPIPFSSEQGLFSQTRTDAPLTMIEETDKSIKKTFDRVRHGKIIRRQNAAHMTAGARVGSQEAVMTDTVILPIINIRPHAAEAQGGGKAAVCNCPLVSSIP